MATARGIDRTRPENRAGGTGRGGHDDDSDTGQAGGGYARGATPAGCAGCERRPSLSRSSAPLPARPLRPSPDRSWSAAEGRRVATGRTAGTPHTAGMPRRTPSRRRRRSQPGVVLIDTVLPYQNAEAAGTGMVLTAVRPGPDELPRRRGRRDDHGDRRDDRRELRREVVGSDPTNDVALLQLTGASGLTTVKADDDSCAGRRRRHRGGQRRGDRHADRRGRDHLLADGVGDGRLRRALIRHRDAGVDDRDDGRRRLRRLRRTAVRRRGRGRRHRHRGVDRFRDRRLRDPDRAGARASSSRSARARRPARSGSGRPPSSASS